MERVSAEIAEPAAQPVQPGSFLLEVGVEGSYPGGETALLGSPRWNTAVLQATQVSFSLELLQLPPPDADPKPRCKLREFPWSPTLAEHGPQRHTQFLAKAARGETALVYSTGRRHLFIAPKDWKIQKPCRGNIAMC